MGTNIKFQDMNITIQNPNTALTFDNKDIDLKPSDVYIDKSVLVMTGQVKNYMTKPDYKFLMKGSIDSEMLAGFVPKENLNAMSYKGNMPVSAQISGDNSKIYITSQILANSSNYFAPVILNKLVNKSSVVNLDMTLANNILNISDIGLYELPSNITTLNDTLSNNIANAYRVVQVTMNKSKIRLSLMVPNSFNLVNIRINY